MFLPKDDRTILSDGMSNEGSELKVSLYIDLRAGKRMGLKSFPTKQPSIIPIKKKMITVLQMRGILPFRVLVEEVFFI